MMASFYIGYAINEDDRYKASSGGVGTAITRYLLNQDDYGTSITFFFNQERCMYEPRLIYSSHEINVCGSVYQDIDIAGFVRNNIDKIRGGIVLSTPPCQVTAVRQILTKANIKHFIISYCCSGQTTIEGTWKYYDLIGVKKEDVVNMQYRGNGWPSGIQIWLNNGTKICKDNYTEPWVTLHRSQLYRPKRCFYCKKDTGINADIALADPWIDEYKNNDKIGNSMIIVNSQSGDELLRDLSNNGLISCVQSSYTEYATAQKPNIQKEYLLTRRKLYIKWFLKLRSNKAYFNWATSSCSTFRSHIRISQYLIALSTPRNMASFIKKKVTNIMGKIRYLLIKNKLGSSKSPFNLLGGVIINNPHCIYIGKNVGIGDNTFIGPVIEYAGIPYNPKIIIGDNTWVGKNCSIAAIDCVEIGNNVLFAGHVHITDHSHGFEDIHKPITPQPLTSKGPVLIDDDCWLGFSCEILSGVHIGKHSIVAARAVVTKDVPPYTVVAGNPARIVKQYNFETKRWEKTKNT